MNIVGILLITVAVLAGIDVVMYLVLSVADRHWEKRFEKEEDENDDSDERGFKRDKPLDNGSGAVSLCVFHSNVNPGECGALTVTPTRDYCRRCAFYKTREDFDRGLGDAARSLRDKGLEPVKKMDYDGRQYMSVRPIEKEDKDDER